MPLAGIHFILFLITLLTLPSVCLSKETTVKGERVFSSDVIVEKGDKLKLLPGSVVKFKPGVRLDVRGELVAEGKPGKPIRLTGDGWGGIYVDQGAEARISNAEIKGADCAIESAGGRLSLKAVKLKDCEKGVTAGKMTVAEITGLEASGIKKTALSIRQESKVTVRDSKFLGKGTGVSVTGRCEVWVDRCAFESLEYGLKASYPGGSPRITGCSFTGNKYGLHTDYPDASPAVKDCVFRKNTYGVYSMRLSSPVLLNCTLTGNEYGVYATEASSLRAEGCRVTGNEYGVYVTFSSYPAVNGCDLSGNRKYAAYLDEQSFDWVSKNGDDQRREKMGMRAAASGERAGAGKTRGMSAPRHTNPRGAYVDFRRNFWGEAALAGMSRAPDTLAEVSVIYDYFDKERDKYEGAVYVRDKVDYSEFLKRNPVNIKCQKEQAL